jgi:predicted Fe-Mo cluster-binding NifX family protein
MQSRTILTDDKYQHFENLFAYFVKLQRLKRTAHLVRLEKSKYYKTINSHGPFVQATLKDYIGEVVSDSPIFVIADHKDRQIKEARVTTFLNPETKEKWQGVQFGDVIIDAYPEKIIVFTDPLEQLTKYSINFITNKGTSIVLGPLVLSDMVKELLEKTSLVYKPRVLKERLNAIINAYIAHKKVEYKIEIEREGFFWIDGELKMSKVACMEEKPQTTQDEVKDALQFIFEVKESFSLTPTQIERLAHEIKWALAAPYDFARRQAGIATKSNNFLPRMDKHGEPDSGKTNGPKYMVLGIYGLAYDDEYVQPYGACDTQPRFINKTGRSTMPIIIDEADELTHWNKDRHAERMLSLLKNQTTMTAPRTILTKESDEITGYSLSPYILTHNSDRIDEDGFLKRVTSMGYTSADKKSKIQIKQFEEYMEKNIHRYVALGRFAINHVMQNQGLLRDRWNIMAEEILDSSFEFAKIERPAWLSTMVTNTSKEDLQDYRRGLVRQLLVNMINDNYIRHRHNIESMISDLGTVDQTDMISKFQALLSVHTLPDFHQKKNGDLLIFTSIKTHLEKVGLDRVSSIKAFAELCGFTYSEQNKINGRNIPAALVSLTDFAAFLAIRLEEPSTDGGQSTLTATPPVV